MALANFSTERTVVTVNGVPITDWGETDPPYSESPLNPAGSLRQGLGGGGLRLDRINPGRTVTLNVNPGSANSAYLQGLFNSKANISLSKTIVGSLETAIGTEGMITNDGTVGRGGSTVTDDVYIFEFNLWTAAKGGS